MIIFVCTGNTCRSPMAEEIFNTIISEKIAISRGVAVSNPSDAAKNAKYAVLEYGGNLENHQSRQITLEELKEAELVITMTSSHKMFLSQYVDGGKIITLAEFAGESGDVSDPYGGDIEIYRETAKEIFDYIKKGMAKRANAMLADETDATPIAKMEKEYFSDSWSEKAILEEIKRGRVGVLKFCGMIIGYCIYMIAADEGEILRIAIHKNFRGYKIGKKLLSSVIEIMEEKGCNQAFLEVRASNTPAISLYKTIGFNEIGVRKGYYKEPKEDAVLFNLTIKER